MRATARSAPSGVVRELSVRASLGLSVFLPPASAAREAIDVTVSFAEYVREDQDTGDGKKKKAFWRRVPQPPQSVTLELSEAAVEKGVRLRDTSSIRVCGKLETADAPGLPSKTRALSLFVVNERTPGEKGRLRQPTCLRGPSRPPCRCTGTASPRPRRRSSTRGIAVKLDAPRPRGALAGLDANAPRPTSKPLVLADLPPRSGGGLAQPRGGRYARAACGPAGPSSRSRSSRRWSSRWLRARRSLRTRGRSAGRR